MEVDARQFNARRGKTKQIFKTIREGYQNNQPAKFRPEHFSAVADIAFDNDLTTKVSELVFKKIKVLK